MKTVQRMRNMVLSVMIEENLKPLGIPGAKAELIKKSWSCTIFFKIKDKKLFIAIPLMTNITYTCFSTFLAKW